MVRARWMLPLVPVVFAACAAAHTRPRLAPYDAQLITEDEIVASHARSAFDVIRKLRGNFLSDRGMQSFYDATAGMPNVYVDEQRYGDVSMLTTIPAEVISSIRLLRAWEATTRYGTGNMGGVIAITTRQGGGEEAAWRAHPRH